MISYLQGKIEDIDGALITLNVNGVGYAVNVLSREHLGMHDEIQLYIRLCWHQDEGPHLFGFLKKDERTIFDLIISCSGVGPKLGLAALDTMNPGAFIQALLDRDAKMLSSIPGIGLKKAESIILQLKDKAAKLVDAGFDPEGSAMLGAFKDLTGVLQSLGYSQKEISPAIDFARGELPGNAPFDACLKKALAYLSKNN